MLLTAHPHDFLVAPYRSRLTSREARLLAVALARHQWEQLTERCRNAVLVGEQYADGPVDDETLLIAWQTVDGVMTVSRCAAAEAVSFAAYPEIEDPVAFVRDAVLEARRKPQVTMDCRQ